MNANAKNTAIHQTQKIQQYIKRKKYSNTSNAKNADEQFYLHFLQYVDIIQIRFKCIHEAVNHYQDTNQIQ